MKIVCSANMPLAREAFETLGEVTLKEGRAIGADDVRDADLLAVRSTTRVDRALLENSRVRFVGTATIGYEHMDTAWLEKRGIRWCYSPGCNANSVSEYIAAALLCLAERHGFTLAGKTLGVVGVGNVGSRVAAKGRALGMTVLPNDPPRARAEGARPRSGGAGAGPVAVAEAFVPLEAVLERSDIVTLHVPLTREGGDRTFHLADTAFFESLKPGAVFLNSARGAVVDTDALRAALERGAVAHAVIDTWEGEPAIRGNLLQRAALGTPHIAGYSLEGKVAGTWMVYREACRFLGVAPAWSYEAHLPPPPVPEVTLAAAGRPDQAVLWDLVRRVYAIEADDGRLRADPAGFDAQRKNYPVRREFRFTRVNLEGASARLTNAVRGLGFG
ncbi:MAG: 4-phosphoerythronate dehydrogenase [Lentisphaerae bacterium]|nr:4-phosphoerythronate dehydrogenase [Lentisphaerota bacterium]